MNIIVCVKQVISTKDLRRIVETNTSIRDTAEGTVNPYDLYAVEEGIRIKEKIGGKVTALSMGVEKAAAMLRDTVGLGVDDAVLLSDPAFAGADTLATTYVLAHGIRKLSPVDLIICGKQAIDGDTAQVAPSLAETLGLPHVTNVKHIEEIREGYIRCQRMTDDGYQVVEMKLPAVISVVKEINEPRLPSLRSMMKAKKAVVQCWNAADIDADPSMCGISGSPTRIVKVFIPDRNTRGELIEGEPDEQAEKLAKALLPLLSGSSSV